MDRLTKEQIEAVWRDVKYLYERSVPNVYPAAYERLRAPFDLALQSLSLESVREEEKFWVIEAVNEDDTVLSPPAYWYGGFVGSTVAGHVGSDIHALCTRFQNAQTAEYVKCLLRNAKIHPDRGHHWKIFKHILQSPARVAEGGPVRGALSNLVSLLLQTMEPIGPMRDRKDYPPELQTAINVLRASPESPAKEQPREQNAEPQVGGRETLKDELAKQPPAVAAPDVAKALQAIALAEEVVFNAAIVADDRMRYEEAKNHRKLSDALRQAAALIEKLGQGWIPVSERLPEPNPRVMGAPVGVEGASSEKELAFKPQTELVGSRRIIDELKERCAELENALKMVRTQIFNLPRSSTADAIYRIAADAALKEPR